MFTESSHIQGKDNSLDGRILRVPLGRGGDVSSRKGIVWGRDVAAAGGMVG